MEGTKHCWSCCKCVAGFDHHCPWLNTCIGDKNYCCFAVAIIALFGTLLVLWVLALVFLVEHFGEGTLSRRWAEAHGGMAEAGMVTILIGLLFINTPFICLDFLLMAFHVLLYSRGLTTYEYLTGKGLKKKSKKNLDGQTNF